MPNATKTEQKPLPSTNEGYGVPDIQSPLVNKHSVEIKAPLGPGTGGGYKGGIPSV